MANTLGFFKTLAVMSSLVRTKLSLFSLTAFSCSGLCGLEMIVFFSDSIAANANLYCPCNKSFSLPSSSKSIRSLIKI